MNTAVLGMGELSWYKDSHFHINDHVSCSEHAHCLSFYSERIVSTNLRVQVRSVHYIEILNALNTNRYV
jgi:hypothetical protein